MDLNGLLKPKSFAIIGASEKDGIGGDVCRNVMAFMEDISKVYFVNPKRETVFEKKCYPSINDIPEPVDLAVLCTPMGAVYSVMEQVAAKGCKGAIIFASGFGEAGPEGKKAEQEVVDLCIKHHIALMGPNCAGYANYAEGIFPFAFLAEKRDRKGSIGLASQSGQVCLSGLDYYPMRFSYVISSGNSPVISIEEYIDFMVDDESTKVVAAYVEGIKKPEVLIRAFEKAAKKKKPIVLLKVGRSDKASELAASHTGSLSGSDKSIDAIMEKFGVIRVNDLQELYATSIALATLAELPKGKKAVFVNVSGGEAGVTADLAYLNDIQLSNLGRDTLDKIGAKLPFYATPNNPLDVTGTVAYDTEALAYTVEQLMKDPEVDFVVMAYTITYVFADMCVPYMVASLEAVADKEFRKPIFWLPFTEHSRNEESSDKLLKINVPLLPTGEYGLKAIKNVLRFAAYDHTKVNMEIGLPKPVEQVKTQAYSEYDSMMKLKENGVHIDEQIVLKSPDDVEKICDKIGFPLVFKIDSQDILHKSDVGGVILKIDSKERALEAYDQILANAKKHCPDAKINGVLGKKMLGMGVEFIVGVNNDPQLGPMVMIGLGGVFVEIFKDVVLRPAKLSRHEAMEMIQSLKGYKMLEGYRGSTPKDVDALADFIVSIAEYAYNHKDTLKELDINPVFVYDKGKGVAVADALVIEYVQ